MIGTGDDWPSIGLYLHGLIDYKMKHDILGFGKLHVYVGASAGLKYTSIRQYIFHHSCWSTGHYSDYITNSDNGKVRFYNDIRAGYTINIGNYSALYFGFITRLTPSYNLEIDYRAIQYIDYEATLEQKGINATYGFEIAFRF